MEALHPEYKNLIKEYAFQPVRDNRGQLVNIMLVRVCLLRCVCERSLWVLRCCWPFRCCMRVHVAHMCV